MSLQRFTKPIDGSIPVPALMYNDEELHSTQDNVGVYDGTQKAPEYQLGTVHLTSHRLFYVDTPRPEDRSFELDLSLIDQTEHYTGLFKSSPKVTFHLSGVPSGSNPDERQDGTSLGGFESWECQVCAYRNPPGLSPGAARVCALCGVPRTAVPQTTQAVSSQHQQLSSSLPSSALASATSLPSGSTSPDPPTPTDDGAIACPACTFLNHPSLRQCELCSTDLPRPQRRSGRDSTTTTKSAPSSRPMTPGLSDDDASSKMIKISFRRGGDKSFYAILKRTLKSKAWEAHNAGSSYGSRQGKDHADGRGPIGMSGISGILMQVENSAQGRKEEMSSALQDLDALTVKARSMVKLAAELNEQLTAANSNAIASAEPEEATFIRSSLSQLGLQMQDKPVTLDMIKDERKWFDELARELARVLQGPPGSSTGEDKVMSGMMKDRGIIALDEVWGGWNRARGVALIPPPTFLQVIPLLPSYTSPVIRHRTFASGLQVLHTTRYTNAAFKTRLVAFLQAPPSGPEDGDSSTPTPTPTPRTTIDIAAEEKLTISLATEMINAVEQEGGICRDDATAAILGGAGGTGVELRWWVNLFERYVWDGQE